MLEWSDNWSKHETKVLIDLWRKYPILYDTTHKDYNNKAPRKAILKQIVAEMEHVRPTVNIYNLRRKMRTLQSQLSKEKSRYYYKIHNDEPYEPVLWCFYDLDFLSTDTHKICEQTRTKNAVDDALEHCQSVHRNQSCDADDSKTENKQCDLIEAVDIVCSPNPKKQKQEESTEIYKNEVEQSCESISSSRASDTHKHKILEHKLTLQDNDFADIDAFDSHDDDYDDADEEIESTDYKNYPSLDLKKLQEKKIKAEIVYFKRKTAYFSELTENVRVERRVMNLKAHKLALEIKKMRAEN